MLPWNQQSDRASTILQNVSVDASVLHQKLVFSHHDLYNREKQQTTVYNNRYIIDLLILSLWSPPKSFVLEIFVKASTILLRDLGSLPIKQGKWWVLSLNYIVPKITIHFAMLLWNHNSDRAPTILQNISVDVSVLQ